MAAISFCPGAQFCGLRRGVVWLVILASLVGCGTASGRASYGAPSMPTSDGSDQERSALGAFEKRGSNEPAASESASASASHELAGPVLERAAFVRAVLRHNPSVESARQGFRAALARVRQAGAFEDPMLELGLAPLSVARSNVPLGYELELSQRLPWFGKRALEAQVASAEAEAVKADYQSLRRELGMTAVILYDQYYVAARSLDINAQHVLLMRAMQAGATAQFESGRASAQDPLQAEAELAHMEHDAVKLLSEREITVAQMNELLHRAPELALPPPKALPAATPVDTPSAQQLEAQAVSASSEIQAARQRVLAEQARADRASRDAYPDFTVSAAYNSMWDMPEHRFMLGLGFNLPIQAGRRGGAADEARAARAQFESEISRLTDVAQSRVFVTLKQLEESAHVLQLFETRLLPVARQQIEAARAGFTTSRSPFVAVVEAERNLRKTELDQQLALAEYHRRRAELDRALGRIPGLDWQEGER